MISHIRGGAETVFALAAIGWCFAGATELRAAVVMEQSAGTGALPALAQVFDPLSTTEILGRLLPPAGAFPANYVDLYRFSALNPFFLSASTVSGFGAVKDPQLFLFDAVGRGLRWNNDRSLAPADTQAALPLMSYGQGTYYLGISWFGVDPVDSSGQYLFDSLNSNAGGPVSSNALAGWLNTGAPALWDNDAYSIQLLSAVPEPGTFGLGVLSACLLLMTQFRYRR